MGDLGRALLRSAVLLIAALLLEAGAAGAQLGAGVGPDSAVEERLVTPDLPADHWALVAALRAQDLGLLDRPLPPRRTLAVHVVGAALHEAAVHAADRGPALQRLAQGWTARFAEEFPRLRPQLGGVAPGLRLLGGAAGVRYEAATGRAEPGTGEFEPGNTGAAPLPDRHEPEARASLAMAAGPRVGLLIEPTLAPGGLALRRVDLGAALGGWTLRLGRETVGYGAIPNGGVVLSGEVRLDRLEIRTERFERLPGFLGIVGPVSFQTFLSRLSEPRHERKPLLWGASGSVAPHPRVVLSIHRAAMFGGRGEESFAVTPGRVLGMLIGRVAGIGFENQVVSVEGRLRLPTEDVLPLTAYAEWGAEDAAGSWWDVPGRTLGVESPALPGLPGASLGVAYSAFGGSCCGNPAWYRHVAFEGGWAAQGVPLGHPLGGHGGELATYGFLNADEARLRIGSRAFWRDRRAENLYMPGRGTSFGATAHLHWRPLSSLDIHASLRREAGSGWTEQAAEVGMRLYF